MTLPLRRVPKTRYGVVLRCEGRRFRLRPTRAFRQVLGYWLAHYAAKHGIQIHAYCAMSNHLHLVLTDTLGLLGDFMRDLGAKLAAWLNADHHTSGVVFSRYRAWELSSHDDLLAHTLYVVLNPVSAGLVPAPALWPGLTSLPQHYVHPDTFDQPPAYHRRGQPDPRYPACAELTLLPPAGWTRSAFQREFAAGLLFWLSAHRAEPGARLYSPLEHFRDLDAFAAPATPEEPSARPPHLSNPTPEERRGLQAWRRAYREARHLWAAGEQDLAVFPHGTFLLVRQHGARVASP